MKEDAVLVGILVSPPPRDLKNRKNIVRGDIILIKFENTYQEIQVGRIADNGNAVKRVDSGAWVNLSPDSPVQFVEIL